MTTKAQADLEQFHEAILLLPPDEVRSIEIIRNTLRHLISTHAACAKLAIVASCLEIAISEGK